ncbi:reverse transcriptase domain-containing protein [Tanacetum coccineum]
MEKLVLSLVFAAKRLRRYFQAHPIAVITDQPIKQIISRPDVAGLLQKMERYAGRTEYHVPAKDIRERTYPSGFDTLVMDQALAPITASWPFYKWGIDIAGPFPEGPGKVKKFAWDNIVCRFGLPGEIVSDNGKQFSDNPFKDWCEKLNITQRFASVKHPQSNRLVERANRSLGKGIKARLGEGNKNWIEELAHVLWAHRTMIKSSHGDTPFSLTYGTESVIPAEIRMPTYHTVVVDAVHNDEELRLNLDLLEERRERATIREAKAKLKMTKYYNAKVRGITFRPGDFV